MSYTANQMVSVDLYLIGGATLLALSVAASKASSRLGVPALLVFLAIGMLAGSEGIGGFYFDNAFVAQTLGIVALAFILFAGGLDTRWESIRTVTRSGILLSTLGVLFTCLLTGWFASSLLDFTFTEGLLLGAIVSSTDAAAVFTVLRAKSVSLKGRIKPLLELESGSNDPMAVFLTIGLLELILKKDVHAASLIPMFFQQMILGGLIGYAVGKGSVLLLNRIKLEYEGLYPVLMVALVLLCYGGAQVLGGNGFLAVYLTGLVLGRESFVQKRSLTLFHDGLAWIMQIAMFLTLGLLVFPSHLVPVAGAGLLISAFLIFVARPLSIFLTLFRSDFSFRERTMVSWVGLKGAVPIILATYPLIAGVPNSELIFNLVFFIVLTSVMIQGTTIPLMARWLKVEAPLRQKYKYPIEYVYSPDVRDMRNDLMEVEVPQDSALIGKTIAELHLPKGTLIVLIQRKGEVLVPRGSTQVNAEDTMLLLAERSILAEARKLIEQRRST